MAKSDEAEHPVKAFGLAATDSSGHLSPFKFSRRATGDEDVQLRVLYRGICHSDLHFLKNKWGISQYPLVGKVKVGDKVGVGCMVGSCRSCESCQDDLENYCPKFFPTYSAPYSDGTITYGGITTYSPMRYFGLDKPGMHIGVVGVNTALERLAKADVKYRFEIDVANTLKHA
ncbi:hypothetical protein SASPL_154656 [Salvia splendens]|uniref:Cinnamyl-alcohol dehydrogenase n=1 Tax=Salvia splendens TaxID=180675 RepID=A0A8X8W0G3_SALSN|nr:hypothetical protein SASPL_154656 [Salvia splendens]